MKKIRISDANKQDFVELKKIQKEFDLKVPESFTHTLIAKNVNGTIMGFLEISQINSKEIEIKKLSVRKKYKQLGIGRKLSGVARAIAIKNNTSLVLFTPKISIAAQSFWKKKQGFKTKNHLEKNRLMNELILEPKKQKRLKKIQTQNTKTKTIQSKIIKPRINQIKKNQTILNKKKLNKLKLNKIKSINKKNMITIQNKRFLTKKK